MSSLLNDSIKLNFSQEKYSDFKSNLNEIINLLSNSKFIEYGKEIKDLLIINKDKEKEYLCAYLFYMNYSKLLILNIEFDFLDDNNIFNELNKIKLFSDKNNYSNDMFILMFYLYLYILVEIETKFLCISKNSRREILNNNNVKQINRLYHILRQIIIIIIKLYEKKIYSLQYFLILIDSLVIFINKNKIFDDKYIKLKNIILFELLFECYGNIIKIILNNSSANKEEISMLFNYILKCLQSNELNSNYNFLILSNSKAVHELITILLNNINYKENIDIYNKYKNEMINWFANIYKNNTFTSNFFELLINQNKNSFINLVNYKTRKENIIKDIYTQNFYISLLYKLFSNEKLINNPKNKSLDIAPPENSFIFNGYNSKIVFQLNKFSLENSLLLFSFQLNDELIKNNSSDILPLIIFESNSPSMRIKIFIQRENNINKIIISQEKKSDKNPKLIGFDKIENILPNKNYYVGVKFKDKSVVLHVKSVDKKNLKYYEEEKEINNFKIHSAQMEIGCDIKNNKYFKGYIGSLIIINNIKVKHNVNPECVVSSILELKDYYKLFPYIVGRISVDFDLNNYFYFFDNKEENKIKVLISFFKKNLEDFGCSLYFTPEILNNYYPLLIEQQGTPLPSIPNIADSQNFNIIKEINVSITKLNCLSIEFQKNNGFDIFCLLYEYYYQLFTIMIENESEFNLDLKDTGLENVIIEIINNTLSILGNYSDYKIIINNLKSFKNLYKNLFETLKQINKKSNIIIQNISKILYEIILGFKSESIDFQKQLLYVEANYLSYWNQIKAILFPFVEGLNDMLYAPDLFQNFENDGYINMLFILTRTFFLNYSEDKTPNKILPFKDTFFYKILGFVKILENLFTAEYRKNKNKSIDSFFNLFKSFFAAIIKEKNSFIYFRQLIPFCVINYENNLIITFNFLKFINEMLWQNYSLDNKEIEILLNYHDKLKEKTTENSDKKLIDEINSTITCILLKKYLFNSLNDTNINSDLLIDEYINSALVLTEVVNEIRKILEKLFKIGIDEFKTINPSIKNNQNNAFNFMDFFWKIFIFIINILKSLLNKIENLPEKEEETEEGETQEDILNQSFQQIFDLLNYIKDLLLYVSKDNRINLSKIYCAFNYIKFYHYIIFNEIKIFHISDKKTFTDNLIEVIKACSELNLLNCNQLFKIQVENKECLKTLIEIIFEIYMNFILKEEGTNECFKILLLKFDDIFYDKQFKSDTKYSIFYANDYLRYLLTQKKLKEKNESILRKYKHIVFFNNEIFRTEEKFEINFSTHFLSLILENEKLIQNNQNLDNRLVPRFNTFMEQLFLTVLQEHKNLFNIDKKFFFKASLNIIYNEQINYIRDKYIKKSIKPEEVKVYLQSIPERLKQKLIENKEENINKEIVNENRLERKTVNQADIKDPSLDNNIDIKDIRFEFPKSINEIKFFNILDDNYVTNQKKELMNNIFALYFIDEFFYNSDFCIMKKYYCNFVNDKKNNNDSKKLNFPSTIKNYRNNLESWVFIKQFNNYFADPFLKVTHEYVDTDLNDKLTRKNSIKLKQKDFPSFENDKEIECELLKNENCYHGKLIYNESGNYLIFKEEWKNYSDDEGFKYIFMSDYFWYVNNKKKTKTQHFRKKIRKKNIIILLDNIEEIIEMRILLLWKGFEIYVKNGKSYLFNFLTTKEYDSFMKNFILKTKLKNLIRKKDFLSEKSIFYEEWTKGLIPNYDYILLVNRYSSRSFNDPTQYYIFPWILNDYRSLETFTNKGKIFEMAFKQLSIMKEEMDEPFANNVKKNVNQIQQLPEIKDLLKEEKYANLENKLREKSINIDTYYSILKDIINNVKRQLRDFSYPISQQTVEKRNISKSKYLEDEEEGFHFPVHSGCHYSNSAYIYFYLMRQQPYDNLIVRLQEYNLENTNRCFVSISTLQDITSGGGDNRELIPEFFTRIEYFFNLNCDYYGILDIKKINLDDCNMDIFTKGDNHSLSTYVHFILQHKFLLNSRIVGHYINQWFDIIFGVNQLPPEKNRIDSCNIFSKITYEQKTNLERKLEKNLKKEGITEKEIFSKIRLCVSQLVNFGITPTQVFHIPHDELKLSNKKTAENNKEDNNIEDINEEFEENEMDIESLIQNLRTENTNSLIKNFGNPLYFSINPSINKIFIYNDRDKLIIYDCQLFNIINFNYSGLLDLNYKPENAHIFYTPDNFIYQIKYGFSSFDKKISYNLNNSIDNKDIFHTYYYDNINYLLFKNNINKTNDSVENFKLITCRHIDSSFQIHYLKFKMNKSKKKELDEKIFTFLSEDFISSCCCVSSDKFILGLNNGKLIYYMMFTVILNPQEKQDKKKKVELKETLYIKMIRYIQAHKGKINSIDIDKRLGIVITTGDDNYIFIRKLYDFELLLPIKIKNKYRILMVKTSPFNFLYILCFNKINNKKIIFGYTLSGMKFAKSAYGLYDNISINEDGDIVTMDETKNMILLSGSDLTKLNIAENTNYQNVLNDIKISNWLQYDCFYRNEEEKMAKILTYFSEQVNGYFIKTTSFSDL